MQIDVSYRGEYWRTSQERSDHAEGRQLLHQQMTISKLEKELRVTNRNYAATVEENDALQDELESARSSIKVLTRNNDRERRSLKHRLAQYEETVAMLQVTDPSVVFGDSARTSHESFQKIKCCLRL